jgi:hypothetical protein
MTQRIIHRYEYPYHVTFNTNNCLAVFTEKKEAYMLRHIILTACRIKGFVPITFSILPTHIHMLVLKSQRTLEMAHCVEIPATQGGLSSPRCESGKIGSGYTISHLMQSIKGTFSRKIHRRRIWQPRYHFRIVTTDKQYHNTLNYILNNFKKHELPNKYGRNPYLYRT